MWTGNCPNCGEPHGGNALKAGMTILCLTCLTPFRIPEPRRQVIARIKPHRPGAELLWDRDDDRDQT